MPRPKKKRKYTRRHDRFEDGYAFDLSPEIKKSILIIGMVAVGGISLLSLFGIAGILGEYVNNGLGLVFGWGRIIVPFLLLGGGFLMYNEDKKWVHGYMYAGGGLFILTILTLFHLFFEDPELAASMGKGGGYLGLFLVQISAGLIGFWATLLVALCVLAIASMLMFNTTISGLVGEDGFFGKLLFPFKFAMNKILRRDMEDDGEEGDYDEEEEGKEGEFEEEDAEYEEEEEGNEFSSREVSEDEEDDEEDAPVKIRKSNIKIQIPFDLLSSKVGKPSGADVKTCNEIIQRTLENFGIPVEMGDYSVGPTVTQYTFKPTEGVKLSRITTLSNDLALALAMHPIRIEAPIPGKSLVGVEVPNKVIARVGLREILDTKDFKQRRNNTMIALGKDVAGQTWMANLAKMPHLLVAGATGSGKSVCLNSIIVSLLYQNNPDDLKFIMVDPKRVELPVYNGIPYLLSPVITDVPKTINALKWCLNEMDRRFDVLAASGKRNIESYNASSRDRMPYLVFVIDELADLMVSAARDVEGAIIRLAQMARAVGIHLILATQRPSVDVITGLIKANIPARIAFSVASAIDSRTILDTQGAEKLLGRGDMLFTTAELSKPKRIQGAYVDDREIKKIVRYIKEQAGEAEYNDEIIGKQKVVGVAGGNLNNEDSDELYEEAKEIIINAGKASTSFLQRRLRIGYARAARLIDLLEDSGIVGPANGAKAREILISKEEYAKVSETGTSGMPVHSREESEFDIDNVLPDEGEEEEEEEESEDYNNEEEEEDDEEETTETEKLETGKIYDDEEEEGEEESENEEDKTEIEEEEDIEEDDEEPQFIKKNINDNTEELPPMIDEEIEEDDDNEEEEEEEKNSDDEDKGDDGSDDEMERIYSR